MISDAEKRVILADMQACLNRLKASFPEAHFMLMAAANCEDVIHCSEAEPEHLVAGAIGLLHVAVSAATPDERRSIPIRAGKAALEALSAYCDEPIATVPLAAGHRH